MMTLDKTFSHNNEIDTLLQMENILLGNIGIFVYTLSTFILISKLISFLITLTIQTRLDRYFESN